MVKPVSTDVMPTAMDDATVALRVARRLKPTEPDNFGIFTMNIMLMVVSERTREIGLRKALGAKRKDIMTQVLTESITLSTFGGVIGILLGSLAATLIAAL